VRGHAREEIADGQLLGTSHYRGHILRLRVHSGLGNDGLVFCPDIVRTITGCISDGNSFKRQSAILYGPGGSDNTSGACLRASVSCYVVLPPLLDTSHIVSGT
jgi:hypothetical protein